MFEYKCKLCGAPMFSEKTHHVKMFCSKKCYGAFLHTTRSEMDALQTVPDMPKLENIHEDGYALLVGAIVSQARRDYLKSPSTSHNYIDAENFFLSDWFDKLTGLDGGEMLEKLQAMRKANRRRKKTEGRKHDPE